jgi:predicted metal-binding membrane protein
MRFGPVEARTGTQYEVIAGLLWRHPEWWVLAASAAAWVQLALHGGRHRGQQHAHSLSLSDEFLNWMLMIAAMMLPLIVDSLRTTAFRSLRSRRHRAMALFLVGYLAFWGAAGLPVAWARSSSWNHSPIAVGTAFLLASVWSVNPIHRGALIACHRTRPLAPLGWRADFHCVQFGLIIGNACALSCWPLMLACTVAGHNFVAMLAGAAVGAVERFSFRPPRRAIAAAQIVIGAFYIIGAWGRL